MQVMNDLVNFNIPALLTVIYILKKIMLVILIDVLTFMAFLVIILGHF